MTKPGAHPFAARFYIDSGRADGRKGRPSVAFLVIVNALLFFAMGAIGNHVLGILFLVPATLFFMAFSAVPQLLVRRFLEKRAYLKPVPRTLAYLSPLWLLFLLGALLPALPQAPNKQNPARSPDGQFEARFTSPAPGWDVVIRERRSGKKWKEETPFLPHLQIYWRWDAENRLWIYNSDDGRVHYLQAAEGAWSMHEWGWGGAPSSESASELRPPNELYPSYARNE